jgi:small conductance mechanosensitive channel
MQLLVAPLTMDQLNAEAEKWQGLLQESMARIANLKVAALTAEGAELDRVHEQINQESTNRSDLSDKFSLILDSMKLKGGDPEVIDGYRKYVSGALASELQATDVKTMLSEALDWTTSKDGGISFLTMTAVVIGSLFLLLIIARFIRAMAKRGLRRISNLSHLMQDFLAKVVYWLVFVIGLMVVLSLFGVNITPLFAVVGGASFILAFAMQDTLGNLASGLMIMINKPFDVGDLVDTNGVLGVVEAVSIVSTTVRTLDNQVVILPNSSVWGSIITNVTVSPTRRVDMVFGIGYSDDIETAQKVLEKLVREHPLVLDDPAPNIAVHELADSSVNFICRPWTKTEDYWKVYWDLTRQVKEGFDQASVSIPFPQRDVHLYSESA